MATISWQFQAAIQGGPTLSINNQGITVQAYDVAQVTLPAGAPATPVPIQPGATSGDVVLVLITSSVYGTGLNYTVDSVGTTHLLDGPHLLIGAGAVAFLNPGAPPQKLTFNTSLASSAAIQVIVGRNVP